MKEASACLYHARVAVLECWAGQRRRVSRGQGAAFSVVVFVVLTCVTGSPYPDSLGANYVILAGQTFITYQGARRNESNLRGKWIALKEIQRSTELVAAQNLALEEDSLVVQGMRTVAGCFCDVVVQLDNDLCLILHGSDDKHAAFFGVQRSRACFLDFVSWRDRERCMNMFQSAAETLVPQCIQVSMATRAAPHGFEASLMVAHIGNQEGNDEASNPSRGVRYIVGIRADTAVVPADVSRVSSGGGRINYFRASDSQASSQMAIADLGPGRQSNQPPPVHKYSLHGHIHSEPTGSKESSSPGTNCPNEFLGQPSTASPQLSEKRGRVVSDPAQASLLPASAEEEVQETEQGSSRGNSPRRQAKPVVAVVRHAERADQCWSSKWSLSPDAEAYPFDPPITEDGIAHAKNLATQLSECSTFKVVVTSPYLRCVQTALVIAKEIGATVVLDHDLGEVLGPDVFGTRVSAPPCRPLADLLRALDATSEVAFQPGTRRPIYLRRVLGKPPSWPESVPAARIRYAKRFIAYLKRVRHTRKNCVVISHGYMLQACLRVLPLTASLDVAPGGVDYCGTLLAWFHRAPSSDAEPNSAAEPDSAENDRSRTIWKSDGGDPEYSIDSPLLADNMNTAVSAAAPNWWEVVVQGIQMQSWSEPTKAHNHHRLVQRIGNSWPQIQELLGQLPQNPPHNLNWSAKPIIGSDVKDRRGSEQCSEGSFQTDSGTVSSMQIFRRFTPVTFECQVSGAELWGSEDSKKSHWSKTREKPADGTGVLVDPSQRQTETSVCPQVLGKGNHLKPCPLEVGAATGSSQGGLTAQMMAFERATAASATTTGCLEVPTREDVRKSDSHRSDRSSSPGLRGNLDISKSTLASRRNRMNGNSKLLNTLSPVAGEKSANRTGNASGRFGAPDRGGDELGYRSLHSSKTTSGKTAL